MQKIITLSNKKNSETLYSPIPFCYLFVSRVDYYTPFHHPPIQCIWPVRGQRKKLVKILKFSELNSVPPLQIAKGYDLFDIPLSYQDEILPINTVLFQLDKQFILDIDYLIITVDYYLSELG